MNSLILNSILSVDNDIISNFINRIFIQKLNLNIDVDFVLSGKEALDLLILAKDYQTVGMPCLLLLDIKILIMNDWEFLKTYEKQVSPEIRNTTILVLLTTSVAEENMIEEMKSPYIKGYIQKPLSENALSRLIHKHFSNIKTNK